MKYLILLLVPFYLCPNLPEALVHSNASYYKTGKDAKKLAEHYRQRVLKGESMSSIAKLYSEDPGSSANGGQYDLSLIHI